MIDQNKYGPWAFVAAGSMGYELAGKDDRDAMTSTDDKTTTSIEDRLELLEQRVRLLDDHNQIMRLLYSYGPSVDSGLSTIASGLWIEDGVYDVDTGLMDGRSEIETMVQTDPHQGFLKQGCGHVMSPARITVSGDNAVAVCHTQLILRQPDNDGYQVSRVTANRWELIRTSAGWKVAIRTSRLLDGRDEPRAILASAFSPTAQDW
ncbi:nuclear transport factor 2 family protein [Prescottella soli]|uniref:Nuclear transport factor 2 family protein n=1 Tax=Prescottella soli TaxID=1543852 RepID=A0ABW9FTU4_9NOCA